MDDGRLLGITANSFSHVYLGEAPIHKVMQTDGFWAGFFTERPQAGLVSVGTVSWEGSISAGLELDAMNNI